MKPNLLLDLDNTLVYAVTKKQADKYAGFTQHPYTRDMVIIERPYLQEFLTEIMRYYNISVWTAARHDYASFIVDNIILGRPNRTVYHLFHRDNVDDSLEFYGSMKNLSLLTDVYKIPMFTNNVNVILDDLAEVCRQKNMCINIAPFYGKNVLDNELLTKLKILISFTERS